MSHSTASQLGYNAARHGQGPLVCPYRDTATRLNGHATAWLRGFARFLTEHNLPLPKFNRADLRQSRPRRPTIPCATTP